MCARKGGYADLTKEILRHFEVYGFLSPVILQRDKEMSTIDVCRKSCTPILAQAIFFRTTCCLRALWQFADLLCPR